MQPILQTVQSGEKGRRWIKYKPIHEHDFGNSRSETATQFKRDPSGVRQSHGNYASRLAGFNHCKGVFYQGSFPEICIRDRRVSVPTPIEREHTTPLRG
jgi:hypothetical protein